MSPPKHLWSGDWQRESEAAARDRAERQPPATAVPEEPAPAPAPAVRTQSPSQPARPAEPRRPPEPRAARARLTLDRAQARLAAIVAAVALLVVGGAYGLNALIGDSSNHQPSVANTNAWLGLQMQNLANGTVVISSVAPGSPAASAGLKPGDVITEVESRPVVAPIDVTEAVAALQGGDTIELQLVRGSSTYTARVKLTARPASFP